MSNYARRGLLALTTAVLACALSTGGALAAGKGGDKSKLTAPSPGVQEVIGEIKELRKARMEEFRSEVEAVIDQARKEGKITAEEASQLKDIGKKHHHHHKGGRRAHPEKSRP